MSLPKKKSFEEDSHELVDVIEEKSSEQSAEQPKLEAPEAEHEIVDIIEEEPSEESKTFDAVEKEASEQPEEKEASEHSETDDTIEKEASEHSESFEQPKIEVVEAQHEIVDVDELPSEEGEAPEQPKIEVVETQHEIEAPEQPKIEVVEAQHEIVDVDELPSEEGEAPEQPKIEVVEAQHEIEAPEQLKIEPPESAHEIADVIEDEPSNQSAEHPGTEELTESTHEIVGAIEKEASEHSGSFEQPKTDTPRDAEVEIEEPSEPITSPKPSAFQDTNLSEPKTPPEDAAPIQFPGPIDQIEGESDKKSESSQGYESDNFEEVDFSEEDAKPKEEINREEMEKITATVSQYLEELYDSSTFFVNECLADTESDWMPAPKSEDGGEIGNDGNKSESLISGDFHQETVSAPSLEDFDEFESPLSPSNGERREGDRRKDEEENRVASPLLETVLTSYYTKVLLGDSQNDEENVEELESPSVSPCIGERREEDEENEEKNVEELESPSVSPCIGKRREEDEENEEKNVEKLESPSVSPCNGERREDDEENDEENEENVEEPESPSVSTCNGERREDGEEQQDNSHFIGREDTATASVGTEGILSLFDAQQLENSVQLPLDVLFENPRTGRSTEYSSFFGDESPTYG